jgi:hypothetical protein
MNVTTSKNLLKDWQRMLVAIIFLPALREARAGETWVSEIELRAKFFWHFFW